MLKLILIPILFLVVCSNPVKPVPTGTCLLMVKESYNKYVTVTYNNETQCECSQHNTDPHGEVVQVEWLQP